VIRASNGTDLLMFYEAGNRTYGSGPHANAVGEYNVMALARSTDNGLTWTRQGVVVSGTDPKPTSLGGTTQPGISEPGMVTANGFLYMFFQYIPNEDSDPEAPSVIQVARAPIASDGGPGSWMKYFNGSWGEPGIGGKGSTIVATGTGTECTRPVMVWPVFNTFLNAYVLTFLCNQGWFFSTSTDLVTWALPTQFLNQAMWINDLTADHNYIFVTPGNPGGVIGRIGYVLYSHSPSRNTPGITHELWVRPFTFSKSP